MNSNKSVTNYYYYYYYYYGVTLQNLSIDCTLYIVYLVSDENVKAAIKSRYRNARQIIIF